MTREELLEIAPLDALGLLDEVEAAMFHRAFHQAPAAVQAEIIEVQAAFAAAEHFLAGEDPRPTLRKKVLISLEEAFEESAESLRPIAQIGSRAAVAPPATRGGDPEAEFRDPAQLAAFRALMEEFAERNARAAARTTPFWRAAAFVLGTALVVSLYMLRQTNINSSQIAELVISQGIEQQVGGLVPRLASYSASGDRTFAFRPSSAAHQGLASAVALVDSARGQVVVATFGLGRIATGTCTIQAVDRDGAVRDVATVEADRFLAGTAGSIPVEFRLEELRVLGPDGRIVLSAKAVGA